MFQIVHHFVKLGCSIGSHTYMVFLSVAGYYGVAAGGITVHFILAYHAGSRILGNHETRIKSRIGNQKFGQSAKSHNELCHTPFRYVSQFGHSNGKIIIYQCQGLSVEVAT